MLQKSFLNSGLFLMACSALANTSNHHPTMLWANKQLLKRGLFGVLFFLSVHQTYAQVYFNRLYADGEGFNNIFFVPFESFYAQYAITKKPHQCYFDAVLKCFAKELVNVWQLLLVR